MVKLATTSIRVNEVEVGEKYFRINHLPIFHSLFVYINIATINYATTRHIHEPLDGKSVEYEIGAKTHNHILLLKISTINPIPLIIVLS